MFRSLRMRIVRWSASWSQPAAPGALLPGFCLILFVAAVTLAAPGGVAAQQPQPGVTTGKSGLQVPRFVSLKAGRVNVRVGPGQDYQISWVFTRAGLPIEVIQEFDTWRRVRDSDGSVGWVFQGLLSGKRTAVVSPWANGEFRPIRSRSSPDAAIAAHLQAGVMATITRCRDGWCRLSGGGFNGWIEQDQLWGVYPNEEID